MRKSLGFPLAASFGHMWVFIFCRVTTLKKVQKFVASPMMTFQRFVWIHIPVILVLSMKWWRVYLSSLRSVTSTVFNVPYNAGPGRWCQLRRTRLGSNWWNHSYRSRLVQDTCNSEEKMFEKLYMILYDISFRWSTTTTHRMAMPWWCDAEWPMSACEGLMATLTFDSAKKSIY